MKCLIYKFKSVSLINMSRPISFDMWFVQRLRENSPSPCKGSTIMFKCVDVYTLYILPLLWCPNWMTCPNYLISCSFVVFLALLLFKDLIVILNTLELRSLYYKLSIICFLFILKILNFNEWSKIMILLFVQVSHNYLS